MSDEIPTLLSRIAAALERLAPPPPVAVDLSAGIAWVWRPRAGGLVALPHPDVTPLHLLLGMDDQKAALLANLKVFAVGAPANNTLLWGARGVGKSALAKAAVLSVASEAADLRLIAIAREDVAALDALTASLPEAPWRIVLFIDDLSFDGDEAAMRALKPILEGGLAAKPANMIVLATSNRRHLIGRDARENNQFDLHWNDTAEERLALADRFGLWLGFHPIDQDVYLAIVRAHAAAAGLKGKDLESAALEWSLTRGARSGRTAAQFVASLRRP